MMLNCNLEKLELAKKEINNVAIIADRAMGKLQTIENTINRLRKRSNEKGKDREE